MNANDTLTTTDYEVRLAALDRAIDRLHADRDTGPDGVVALAAHFEHYLRGEATT
jgi:uncharacterized small protein (DUF1192 family)